MISGAVGPGDHEQNETSIYLVSVLGGSIRRLRGGGLQAELSPDDRLIVYDEPQKDRFSLWLCDANGENPRPFIEAELGEFFISPRWSSDGKRVVYRHWRTDTNSVTIESRGLDEETSVVLVHEGNPELGLGLIALSDFLLLDGRLVYARDEPAPSFRDRNLWEIAVDPRSGKPQGDPKRLTDWVGLEIKGLTASADGSTLAFRDAHRQDDVWVGELSDGGRALDDVRRLTLDDRHDRPACWMPGDRAIVLDSMRNGNQDLFVQGLDQRNARDLVVAPAKQLFPQPTPDGAFLLYWETEERAPKPTGTRRLFRTPMGGGSRELVLETHWPATVQCASRPDGPCLLGETRSEENAVTWSRLDPVEGKGEELWRVERDEPLPDPWTFSLSPDGSRLATVLDDEILVTEIASGRTRSIQLEGLHGATGLAWAHDGSGFYVTSAPGVVALLLHVDLQGNTQSLHEFREIFGLSAPTPSPDGRYLAFAQASHEANLWLVEKF